MKFKWTKIWLETFEDIKRVVDCNVLSSFPGFNKKCNIYKDARKFQLGAFINQDEKSIVFYGIKLIDPKMGYTVTERVLLIIF